ncbi:MAG TPA: HDOD domain-containing protein [Phycisphaerae bacterium]|nr:HDOD domain-containing protein [Phycisphaerae bacterium]HNU46119.1 HDOD domain-containing protein [Phycisphaerae bacterium]
MGVWDWLVGTLGRQCAEGVRAGDPAQVAASGGAVATLDPVVKEEPPAEVWWAPPADACTDFPPLVHPELTTEGRALQNALVSHFDGHNLSIPALPQVPERVLRRLRSSDCDFGKVANDIATDQVIAGAVIRMVNSPLYGGAKKITSLRAAVTRLGANALRTLMMYHSLQAAHFDSRGKERDLAQMLWRRALAGAAVMQRLSELTGADPEEAFLLGLLHDIGNVVVLRETQHQREIMRFRVDLETFEYLCQQCHQEFGELIATAWELPPRLRSLISDHHCPPAADDPHRRERLQLQLADMITVVLGYAPRVAYDLLGSRPALELGLVRGPQVDALLAKLPGDVDDIVQGGR